MTRKQVPSLPAGRADHSPYSPTRPACSKILHMKYRAGEKQHGHKTHERWIEKTERISSNPEAPWEKQCFNCQYYMYLAGPLRNDWGVCSNPESPFDATVRFEQGHLKKISVAFCT